MKCDDARSKLSALLDRAVEAGLRDAVARHVDGCGACRAEWAALAGTDGVVAKGLATAVAAAPPANYFQDFWTRLSARLDDERREVDAMAMSTTGSEDRRERAQGGEPPQRNEVSGLHDIRALARTTIERHAQLHPDDLGEVVDSLLATASPASLGSVLLPEPGREVKPAAVAAAERAVVAQAKSGGGWGKTLFFSAAVLVAGGAVAFVMYTNNNKQLKSQQTLALNDGVGARPGASAAPAPEVRELPAEKPADVAPTPEGQPTVTKAETAPAAAGAPAQADRVADKGAAAKGDKGAPAKDVKDKNAATPAGATPPADKGGGAVTPPPPAGGEPAPAADKDKPAGQPSLDDILGKSAPPPADEPEDKPAPAPAAALPEKLSSDEVKKGMRAVSPRVGDCYSKYKISGTVMIKVKIDPDGSVSSAIAVDKFANTDTGFCVAEAVVLAKFPQFSGNPMSFNYPFKLQ